MADEQGEKTEKPSPKRLKDARERGEVATSRDLSLAAGSLAATGALVAAGSFVMRRLVGEISRSLMHLGDLSRHDITSETLGLLVVAGGGLLAVTAGPVALAAAAAGVFSSVAQSGFNVSMKALEPNWGRLNPANGLKRLAPSRAGIDTLKAVVISIVLGMLAWRAGKGLTGDAARLTWTAPTVAATRGWDEGLRLLWQAGFALLAVGAADYGIQRWRLMSSLKMSRQEVRDEARQNEGNPEVRSRVRRIQRDMMRRRMLQAVPQATVVITNPTHFAVALEYRREKNAAPVVVAKGQDLMAARIRDVARGHSVPIMENPSLARALFKECEVGDTIPGPLFGAVAEVLAYLIRIKQLVL